MCVDTCRNIPWVLVAAPRACARMGGRGATSSGPWVFEAVGVVPRTHREEEVVVVVGGGLI